MRHQHVGREHPAQVAAEIAFAIEIEQFAVARVGVHELADLVVVDRHKERWLRQRVEHNADAGRQSGPLIFRSRFGAVLGAPLCTRLRRVLPSLSLPAFHTGAFP